MRFMIRSLVLTSAALCATAAFAANTVNIPFNFESHGHAFPAGRYEVSVDSHANVVKLNGVDNTTQSAMWVASPAESDPAHPMIRLIFDDAGYTHELRSVQFGSRITSVLDAPAKHHYAGSSVVTAGGQ